MRGKIVRIRLEELQLTMRYVSTRGAWARAIRSRSRAILLEGLAPDGGLAVPEHYPRFSAAELEAMRALDYPRPRVRGAVALHRRHPAATSCARIVDETYTRATFGSDAITPLSTLEPGLHLLHLSNGPTLAFKDIALQLLGSLFEHVLARERRTLNILGATSRRHGLVRRARAAGQARRGRLHALAARAHERVPARADVLARRRRTSTTSPSRARSTTARTS